MNILNKMLNYSEKMYAEPGIGTIIKTNTDYAEVIIDENDDIIIAFRGTDNIRGWISDLNCYELYDNQNIHDGFFDAFNLLKSKLYSVVLTKYYLIKNKTPKFFITGHSRGAALALLYARYIHSKFNGHDISCIVFGCPRVGNKRFRHDMEALPVRITRVVNGYDLVDKLPLRIMGFRHVGKSVKLPQQWWHRFVYKVRDHLTKNYWKGIKNYERKKNNNRRK